MHVSNGSEIAKEALDRIGVLYDVEAAINGITPDERRCERQSLAPDRRGSQSLGREGHAELPARSNLAAAFRYMLSRWLALTRCLDDGRLSLDNNPAERALRGVALARKPKSNRP